jgi:hypothetical protein
VKRIPGLCAFDFQQITELVFTHILVWDEATQQSKPEGGAFGILVARTDSIEEKGRKHAPWAIYLVGTWMHRIWHKTLMALLEGGGGSMGCGGLVGRAKGVTAEEEVVSGDA